MTKKEFDKEVNDIKQRLTDLEDGFVSQDHDFEFPHHLQSYEGYKGVLVNQKAIILDMLLSKKRYAQIKLEYIADKLNGDWKVDYDSYDSAYYLYFDCDDDVWEVSLTASKSAGGIYFKTRELALKAFEIMGKEMNYLRGEV